MRKIQGAMALAFAMILLAASWSTAHAQTGDCFSPLSGCLDTTFGTNVNGRVVTGINNNSSAQKLALEPIKQPDNTVIYKIVAATEADPSGAAVIAVVRYNLDGSLDTSFQNTGIVVTNIGGYVKGLAIQTDGKIVVVGFGGVIVVRFNTDGSLDSTFGSGGVVNLPATRAHPWAAWAVAIQNDNKIVVAGNGNGSGMAAWRFNANGSLDSSFGSGGNATVTFGKGSTSRAFSIILQSVVVSGITEQRIVLGGWECGANPGSKTGYDNFALARLTTSGQLDSSFGSSGEVTRDFAGYNDLIYALAIDPQNRIVAAGYADVTGAPTGGGSEFAVARYNADGSADLNFGSNGAVTLRILAGLNQGRAVALQSNGSIVVAGYAYTSGNKEGYMTVARFTAAGAPDGTFGSNGFVTTDFSSFGAVGAVGYGLVLQSDGKILVGGEAELTNAPGGSTSEVGLARYFQ